jgi:hypothetical protein
MTAEELENEFRERGVVRGGLLFLRRDEASNLIQRAKTEGLRVLGVDGFIVKDKTTQPSMTHSLDLTSDRSRGSADSWDAACEFLERQAGRDLYFEVVLE